MRLMAKIKDAPPAPEMIAEVNHISSNDDPMADAPRDGRWIEVTTGGDKWVRARFYQTRIRMPGRVVWVPVQCWSTTTPSKYAHRVEAPIAWRPVRETEPAVAPPPT
jgi:hypothetical protein